MAPSSPKYPYPSEVNVGDFVTFKLSPTNYSRWKSLMLSIIEYEGLEGFINGTIAVPPETREDFQDWKRSDRLVGRWILATVNEDLIKEVTCFSTAEEMWKHLGETCTPFYGRKTVMAQIRELGRVNLYQHKPLYTAIFYGEWEDAKKFIEKEPESVRSFITTSEETALMIAIRTAKNNGFVKELVEKMSREDVALPNIYGSTALHEAAGTGNIAAARLLVNKNQGLLQVLDKDKCLPLHYAASCGKKEMVRYLLEVTKEDVEVTKENEEWRPYEDESGGRLLQYLISSALYDMALSLVKKNPKLACWDISPLNSIASRRSSFRSGARLSLWQRFIYFCVPVNLENFVINHTNGGDGENAVINRTNGGDGENAVINRTNGGDVENPVDGCISDQFVSGSKKLCGLFSRVADKLGIKKLLGLFSRVAENYVLQTLETKLKHRQALLFVEYLCNKIAKSDYSKAWLIFGEALNTAAVTGVSEVVEQIMVSFPEALQITNEMEQTVFQVGILNRHENIFNIIYQFENPNFFPVDISKNSCLHLAACLGSQQKLNLRSSAAGAALQMQRELQWYKGVEKLSPLEVQEWKNSDGKTPAMLFTETHQDLVTEGEKWMKDTSTSCTIVAALIATVVFAAAITVPGGNNGGTGLPIFSTQKAFIVFAVSDALALFSSTSSVLMFLSILTARYGEDDFLKALPSRLIIGLIMLFLATLFMMIAFSSTLYLVFAQENLWILLLVIALAGIPVTLFVFLQFPLLKDMIKSTYGPKILGKRSHPILSRSKKEN